MKNKQKRHTQDGGLTQDGGKTQGGKTQEVKRSKSGIIINIIFCIIIALAAATFAVVIVARIQNKNVSFFGYSFAIVVTDSMEPEIKTGSLIVVKECGISADYVGRNVVFVSQSGELAGENVVHKAVDSYEQDGEIYLVTMGVKHMAEDDDPVTAENFVGVCVAVSYSAGVAVSFLASYGVPLVIAVIAVPIIVKLVIYIVKTARNNGEE